ncbi:hypothetical protein ACOMHN_009613 [Nucella lapillus]
MEKRHTKQMSSPESVTMARQCMRTGSRPSLVTSLSRISSDDLSSPGSPEVQHLWAHGGEAFRPGQSTPPVLGKSAAPVVRKRLVFAKLTSHRSWPAAPSW